MKSMINEFEQPNYSDNEYPHYKYFLIDNCQTLTKIKNDMENNLKFKTSYPILANYLIQGESIKQLENLLKINPFANYMLNLYSYTITRDEANVQTFDKFLNTNKDKSLEDMYSNFEQG